MSAFLVNDDHVDFLVTAAIEYRVMHRMADGWTQVDRTNADTIGMMLLAENAASVSDRYAHCDDLSADERGETAAFYRFRHVNGFGQRLGMLPVDVLKAIACYRYQACEHDGWSASGAAELCERLQSAAVERLAGYSDAQWEWSRTAQDKRTAKDAADAKARIAACRIA